jgi:threonine aldolase
MNLLGALLGGGKRGGDPAMYNKLLRQEVDKQLADYDQKLEAQIRDRLAKMTGASADERRKTEDLLVAKKAEGMQKLRDAAEAQYTKNRRQ